MLRRTEGFPCGSVGEESTHNAEDLGPIPGLGRSPGEGKGYALQDSGLENSMDYIVHGVTKSRTRLSDFHFTSLLQEGLNWGEKNYFLSSAQNLKEKGGSSFIRKKEESFKFEILKTSVQKNHLRCWLQRQIPKTLSLWALNGGPESEF